MCSRLQQLLGRLAAHDLDRVLVAEVVRALDGVEGVRLPRVALVERGVDPALRGVGVRAHGVDLADDPDRDPGLGRGERGALAGEAGADHEYVVAGPEGIGRGILCIRARPILKRRRGAAPTAA